jgi:glycosyltransferase involved in cell wall biosynthesis
MPKVSVIIPIYNVEQYLRECIDSVVKQTLKDIEIILVNDGSTDNCPEICDEYAQKDSRIKVIHQTNGGLGKAYNAGINSSTSPYIGFVESDDWAEPDMFENLYNLATENDAEMVKSQWYYYWTTPEVKNIISDEFKDFPKNQVINARQYPKLILIKPTIWSAIYKKEFLDKYKIKFLETPGASYQDLSFALNTASAAQRLVLTERAYIHYRNDNMNASVKSKEKVYYVCDEYAEVDRFLNENPDIKNYIEPYKWQMQYGGYLWNIDRIDEKYREEFAVEMRNTFLRLQDSKPIMDIFLSNISPNERENVKALIENSNYFLTLRNLKNKNKELNNRISVLRQDNSNCKIQIEKLKKDNKKLKNKIKKLSVIKINLFGIKISHRRKIKKNK